MKNDGTQAAMHMMWFQTFLFVLDGALYYFGIVKHIKQKGNSGEHSNTDMNGKVCERGAKIGIDLQSLYFYLTNGCALMIV